VNGDANKDANGALTFYYNSANGQIAEGMRLNSSGNVGIGTASPSAKLEVPFTGSLAGMRIQISSANYFNATNHFFRTLGDNNLVQISGNYIDASFQANYGLRLPATPGNPDTQTLDAYQESTAWTPVVTGAGGTTPTVFASTCTRIGRLVICNIVLTATGGNTYSSTYSTTTINLPVAAAALCAATLAQGTNAVPNATVSGGNILLPTFALTTVATVVTALYYV
jgi:hypothetical protein